MQIYLFIKRIGNERIIDLHKNICLRKKSAKADTNNLEALKRTLVNDITNY